MLIVRLTHKGNGLGLFKGRVRKECGQKVYDLITEVGVRHLCPYQDGDEFHKRGEGDHLFYFTEQFLEEEEGNEFTELFELMLSNNISVTVTDDSLVDVSWRGESGNQLTVR